MCVCGGGGPPPPLCGHLPIESAIESAEYNRVHVTRLKVIVIRPNPLLGIPYINSDAYLLRLKMYLIHFPNQSLFAVMMGDMSINECIAWHCHLPPAKELFITSYKTPKKGVALLKMKIILLVGPCPIGLRCPGVLGAVVGKH